MRVDTHELNIVEVIAVAGAASLIGRIIGYGIGWRFGYWLLLRYGGYLAITEKRIKLGQYLFLKHGGVIIIIAQFVPVMRAIAGILAVPTGCRGAGWCCRALSA